jgi:hypothetical protein
MEKEIKLCETGSSLNMYHKPQSIQQLYASSYPMAQSI